MGMRIAVLSGRLIDLDGFDLADFDLMDVSHPLSQQCRFGGHTTSHYSVAQHSVAVASLARELAAEAGASDAEQTLTQFQGLLHDAHEAYVIDLPKPIRDSDGFETYRALERRIMGKIMQFHDLPKELSGAVQEADRILLDSEIAHFWGEAAVKVWGAGTGPYRRVKIDWVMPHEARISFELMYRNLMHRR